MNIFSSFSNMKLCCVLLLESAHRVDSNEYTQHTSINMKKKKKKISRNYLKYYNVCSYGIFFCKGLKNEFETAMVNEQAVFEPLKFYCVYNQNH